MKLKYRKISLLAAVSFLAVFLWNCEKDDICDQAVTTPRLIVEFYDSANPTVLKNVTNLTIIGDGMTDTLGVFNAVSKAELPLKTTTNTTTYKLTLNSNNTAIDNQDVIQFNYATEEVFVSRACGYKTLFALDAFTPYLQTDPLADGPWMQNITVSQPNIETENETHVKIYF